MQVTTALAAVRILGVDLANYTMRCAVYQAAAEEILELVSHIDVTQWRDMAIGEGDDARFSTIIPVEQREFLEHLLDAVDGLR